MPATQIPIFPKAFIKCTMLVCAIFLVNCTFTTTRTKNPVFKITTDQLQRDLNHLVSCENMDVDGREISTNGKTKSELEIDIVNGRDIPGNQNEMISLGKSIASDLKKSLKDQGEYGTYKVRFVTKETNDGITRTNWNEIAFQAEEL